MIYKLRLKFIFINMTIVTVMLGIIFGMVYSSIRQNLESRAVTLLRSIASEPRRSERPGGDNSLPYFVLQIGRDGEILSKDGGFYDLSDEEFLQKVVDAAREQGGEMGILKEHNLRYYQRMNKRGTALAFCDMSSERSILNGMARTLAIVGSISFLIFLEISVLFSRWAVRPVEQAWNEQKQFIADASHELKTPLTVIITNAELLQSEDSDSENRRQFSDSILTMSRQMRGLVEKMLTLARGDAPNRETILSDVNLSRLAEDCELTFEAMFFEKGLSLVSDIAPDITIRGDSEGLRQVIDILLDNAAKYSTPGGETMLSLTASGGKCRLAVANPGPEISSDDLNNIFRRFYRVDQARSRDGSYGLGLAIARQVVQRLHGTIRARSENGTNTFTVELPVNN